MKKFLYIALIALFFGCNSENAWDCFQTTGDIIQQEYELDGFNKIIVWNRVQLFISQGDERKVVIETGENLINEVRVRVEDSILKVSDRNSCNYTRDYDVTKVFVTFNKDSLEIRNSSGLTVTGVGPIEFKNLVLISEDREQEDEFHIDGDFRFDNLDVGELGIQANGISKFYLKGNAVSGNFGLYDGDVRVEAAELEVFNLFIFHRSTNKMIVNPINRIQGRIFSTGDVIAKNRPPIIDVEELFTGKLIFE
ncbi:MAG: hypothetical protein CL596_02665 [Alteromonas sp.]|nr:hypothetical protein [Alteromonas sp.]MAY23461.1 hypothetical protein [Flavobacteriaceae bacterium]|tara:strand:+ start:70498 stop:71253 length:756 start_codon:yes stop_codon:yes gene_type:complete